MPKFVAKFHDKIIVHFLSTGFNIAFAETRSIYLCDRNKFIFPSSIDIRNLFGFQTDLVY